MWIEKCMFFFYRNLIIKETLVNAKGENSIVVVVFLMCGLRMLSCSIL